mgnify:CR=1 FL=1
MNLYSVGNTSYLYEEAKKEIEAYKYSLLNEESPRHKHTFSHFQLSQDRNRIEIPIYVSKKPCNDAFKTELKNPISCQEMNDDIAKTIPKAIEIINHQNKVNHIPITLIESKMDKPYDSRFKGFLIQQCHMENTTSREDGFNYNNLICIKNPSRNFYNAWETNLLDTTLHEIEHGFDLARIIHKTK